MIVAAVRIGLEGRPGLSPPTPRGAMSSVGSTWVSEREMDYYGQLCVQGQVDHERGAQMSRGDLIMA